MVEDDSSILANLEFNLKREGYDVLTATDGVSALDLARSRSPDLILLDLMLPLMTGTEICRSLRRDGDTVPIIMLTARTDELDRVVGLEAGADDYVPKPFSVREVVARVGAMLRRVDMDHRDAQGEEPETITIGDLTLDLASRESMKHGERVHLRPKEFDLLVFLSKSRGRAFSRDQLLEHVWGYDYAGDTRTVDVHVRWLRQKIEADPSDPQLLLTVRGVGYRITA